MHIGNPSLSANGSFFEKKLLFIHNFATQKNPLCHSGNRIGHALWEMGMRQGEKLLPTTLSLEVFDGTRFNDSQEGRQQTSFCIQCVPQTDAKRPELELLGPQQSSRGHKQRLFPVVA